MKRFVIFEIGLVAGITSDNKVLVCVTAGKLQDHLARVFGSF